jgi:hypothetical protein
MFRVFPGAAARVLANHRIIEQLGVSCELEIE